VYLIVQIQKIERRIPLEAVCRSRR